MTRIALVLAIFLAQFLAFAAEVLREVPYRGAIAANSQGRVVFEDGADRLAYPASVSKLMTALLILDDIRQGRYSFETKVVATADVRMSEPSWIGLKPGDQMSVRDLLYALMVMSANDGAIALAVHSAGTMDAFVARMNARAERLGMLSTRYYNPNGLPPNPKRGYSWTANNITTARDQLKLAMELLKYSEILAFTSAQACDLIRTESGYRVSLVQAVNHATISTRLRQGERIVRRIANHNNVMCNPKFKISNADSRNAVDGFKTGYIDAGGSSVILTASREGKRVIVVVLGSDGEKNPFGLTTKKSGEVRDENARRILADALGSLIW